MAKRINNPFRNVKNAPCAAIEAALHFDGLLNEYESAKDNANKLVSAGIEALMAQGIERKEAISYARKALMQNGLEEKRASELLVKLGFKVRNGGGTPAEIDSAKLDRIVQFIRSECAEDLNEAAKYANRALLQIRELKKA